MVLEKALKDCIRNVVTMFEATFAQHLIKNIYKMFGSNCGVDHNTWTSPNWDITPKATPAVCNVA
jgi:hypothetical protein